MKRRWLTRPVTIALTVVAVVALVLVFLTRERYGLPVGTPMPQFVLEDSQERRYDSSELWGKVTVIAFWKVSVPASTAEILGLEELRKTYGERGFEAVGISLDEEGKYVKAFVHRYQVGIPLLIGSRETAHLFGGVKGVPTLYIFDRKGKVVDVLEGFRGRQVIEKKILDML